jgi:hypothetical protein
MVSGFVDPSFGPNRFRGESSINLNQAFGRDGAANDDGHATTLPSRSSWEFKCTRFYNLAAQGVKVDRSEGHDLLETLDAAHIYGIQCIFTLGGLSDPNTWQQAEKLLDTESAEFREFQVFMAKIADALYGHPALKLLEALNEADFRSVIKGHWLKLFPQGYMQLLRGFAVWQVTLLDGVRELQMRKGTPLGNGTAMDGTLYTDPNGNAAMPWGTNECIYEIIPLMGAGCDVWTPHIYQNEDNPDHLLVLRRDKVPSFVRAAEVAAMELIIAEAGALWRGGTRTAELQAVFDQYPGLTVCWMIRSWDPKIYSVPVIPVRVPYSPAPVETPVETPAPVANDPVPEPSDSSSPAQDTPEEEGDKEEGDKEEGDKEEGDKEEGDKEEGEDVPPEAAEPPAVEEPASETPATDPPANEPPSEDPTESTDPGEETSNGNEGAPEGSTVTGNKGAGFVIIEILRWIFSLFRRR